jgi:protein-disulfide isomerase
MKRYLALAVLVAAFALGGAWMLTRPAATPGAFGQTLLPGAAMAEDSAAAADPDIDISTIRDMTLGDANAPVTLIEYASFTCPHCARFHADQFQRLKADYIDTGKVHFIYREVYFDRFGLWASMIARCGGPMRFFGISELLYDQQQDWIAGGRDPALIADNLRKIGIAAGLDAAVVDACMRDETMARTLVAWFEANAARDGVNATPTLIIDGVKHQNMAYADLAALIDAALAD